MVICYRTLLGQRVDEWDDGYGVVQIVTPDEIDALVEEPGEEKILELAVLIEELGKSRLVEILREETG